MQQRFIYLHGFGSSPKASKAIFLGEKLDAMGHTLEVPDLNVPTFRDLTLTAMIDVIARTIGERGPVNIIASSMGAQAGLHCISRNAGTVGKQVNKILLLAPLFDFYESMKNVKMDPPDSHRALVDDFAQYQVEIQDITQPIYILHGTKDTTVPPRQSQRFAAGKSNVTLELIDSEHTLHDAMPKIWEVAQSFFELK